MRVQNPIHLAEILLAHDKGLSADGVAGYVRRGGEIKLSKPIPVHVTYFTATVGDDGKLQHWPDIYGLDPRVASAMDGPAAAALVTSSISASEFSEPTAQKGAKTKTASKKGNQPQSLVDMIFGN